MKLTEEQKKIIEWESLSRLDKVVMVAMLPIFAVVAGLEHIIAKLTGATYNEVNIIVYYLIIPVSWAVMIDYITMLPFLTLPRSSCVLSSLYRSPAGLSNRLNSSRHNIQSAQADAQLFAPIFRRLPIHNFSAFGA